MKIKKLGEDHIIDKIRETFRTGHPRIIKSIGDDTSVTAITEKRCLLLTIDSLIEGVHFKKDYTPPYYIGRKAVSISVSDIAAMGGTPLFLLTAISMPEDTDFELVEELYRGIKDSIADYGIHLVGGNTSKAESLSITTTLVGEADKHKVVYRSGAKPEDVIYITGTTGDSALGLEILSEEGIAALENVSYREAVLKHLNPVARVGMARALAEKGLAHAMIDVSDGLVRDLGHITEQSNVGAIIECERLPLSQEMLDYPRNRDHKLWLALTGGEDYELLFTSPPEKKDAVELLARRLNIRVTPIGIVTEGKGTKVLDRGEELAIDTSQGYQHFVS
ncbi:MAG TPA: thiamine-phosphate kinase [Deltaproteobacteria bacterium]|nr:thiamine-phosphate kinase [Deltaproteobacteria bacterium]